MNALYNCKIYQECLHSFKDTDLSSNPKTCPDEITHSVLKSCYDDGHGLCQFRRELHGKLSEFCNTESVMIALINMNGKHGDAHC